ncbi:hypothetical protein BH11VER1_BH11VER1_30990 [soil metagenome]
MAKLTFILDDEQEIEVPLSERITIGRVEGNDVVVDDPRMSSRHAEVKRIGEGQYEVRDLGSKGGTFINGERVERKKLQHGDRVNFGPLHGIFENRESPGPVEEVAPAAEFTVLPGRKNPGHPEAGTAEKPVNSPPPLQKSSEEPLSKQLPGLDAPAIAVSGFEAEAKGAIAELQRAKAELQAEIGALQSDVKGLQSQRTELSQVESRKQEIEARLRHTVDEVELKTQRVSNLAKEERRLGHVTDALREAELKLAGLEKKAAELTGEMESKQAVTTQQTHAADKVREEFAALSVKVESAEARLRTVTEEVETKSQQVSRLVAEEKRLALMPQMLKDAEASHLHWLESIATLKVQQGQRQIEWEKLQAEAESAQQEVWQLNASKEQSRAQLEELKEEEEGIKARLEELQKQAVEAEVRSREALEIANTREAQVSLAEEKLENLGQQRTSLETQIAELTGTEEKLRLALEGLKKTEGLQTSLLAAVALLEHRSREGETQTSAIESRVASLKTEQAELDAKLEATKTTLAADDLALVQFKKQAETTRQQLTNEKTGLEQEIARAREGLQREQTGLVEIKAKRTEIARQCDELAETESKLSKTKKTLQESEARVAQLQTQQNELESKVATTKTALVADEKSLADFKQESVITREKLQGERAGLEKEIASCRDTLKTEKTGLADITAKRAEIARQCDELVETESKLTTIKATLVRAEASVIKAETRHKELETEHGKQEKQLTQLQDDEEKTKARINDLEQREESVKKTLAELTELERTDRDRFEAIRKLTAEAEGASQKQKDELAAHLNQTQRELAAMESKLSPLREWKEDMDKRYARLASLPENSDEAKELWREIEAEKANLRKTLEVNMPGAAPAPAAALMKQGGGIRDLVLRSKPGAKSDDKKSAKSTNEVIAPDERAAIGTGSLISGTGQEMALNARLNRLRESVAREASRLEFLRQERSREEMRAKKQ